MKAKGTMPKRLIIYILLSSLFFLSCTKSDDITDYPVFGVDKLQNVRLIESSSEALAGWAQNDIEDAVLLLVSDESSLSTVPIADIQKLRSALSKKKWKSIEDSQGSLYSGSNYIDAAVKLGIINRIYWVLPYTYFNDIPLAGKKIKKFLQDTGHFMDSEIDMMKMDFGCLKGSLPDMELSICSPRTLPKMNEPVLMAIDVDFFRVYADELKRSNLSAMKRFFDEMAFRELRVAHVDISFGTKGGGSRSMHRFIGNELFEGVTDPGVFAADTPPELWQHRDMAENMLTGAEDIKVVEYLLEPLKKYPEDIPLRMLNVTAKVKSGTYDEALDELTDICSVDKYYCYGFIDIGNIFVEKKKPDIAGRYFLKALEALSGDPYVVRRYVRFLENSGREDEADSVRKKHGMD